MKKNNKQLSFCFNDIDSVRNEILEDECTFETLEGAKLLILAQVTLSALKGESKAVEQYMKYIVGVELEDAKPTEINITKVVFKNAK